MTYFFHRRRLGHLAALLLAGQLAGCGITLTPPGLVREHRHGVCRGWFDWNSHRRPSFTFERYDRLPPESARVKLFRWQHGGSVESWPEISEGMPLSSSSMGELFTPIPNGPNEGPTGQSRESFSEDSSNNGRHILPPPPAPPSEPRNSDQGDVELLDQPQAFTLTSGNLVAIGFMAEAEADSKTAPNETTNCANAAGMAD